MMFTDIMHYKLVLEGGKILATNKIDPPPRISMFKFISKKKNASAAPSLGSPGDYTQREGQLQASKMGGDVREPRGL